MTSAHRPTFDPARGKDAQTGVAFHVRALPSYTVLKTRQNGQGRQDENVGRDLRAELLKAEAAHYAKKKGIKSENNNAEKRKLEDVDKDDEDNEIDTESKRVRTILEEARDIDADSASSDQDSEDEEDEDEEDDEEDETALLMAELAKIKKERAQQRAKEEEAQAEKAKEEREFEIARGNPLLNAQDTKRRWDDDVIFRNQGRGTDDKKPKEFVNDLLRSDFHKRFMNRFVR